MTTSTGSPRTRLPSGTPLEGAAVEVGAVAREESSSAVDQVARPAEWQPLDLERRRRSWRPFPLLAGGNDPPDRRAPMGEPADPGRPARVGAPDGANVDEPMIAGPGIGSGGGDGGLVLLAKPADVIAEGGGGVGLRAPPPSAPGCARRPPAAPRSGALR